MVNSYTFNEMNEVPHFYGHTLSLQDDTITLTTRISSNYLELLGENSVKPEDFDKDTVRKYVIPRMDQQ